MLWDTKQAVQNSLLEFTPTLRARHHIVKLASGKWTRTLGPPSDTEKYRVVNVRGREWKQVPRHVETEREWWQTKAVHHATKKNPAQLQREIDEVLAGGSVPSIPTKSARSKRSHSTIQTGSSSIDGFWDIYEEELTKSVARDPSDYGGLQIDEPPEVYARRIRESFQKHAEDSGLGMINLDSNTFKRLARRLGIAKFSQRALKAAYVARGGKP